MNANQLIKQIFLLIVALVWLPPLNAFATPHAMPLPVDKAFALSLTIKHSNSLYTEFNIAPGYYLYRQQLHFTFEPKLIADIVLPQAKSTQRSDRRSEEVYSGEVIIPITLRTTNQQVQFTIDYQGCSERGFCYPPQSKTYQLNLMDNSVSPVQGVTSTPFSSFQALLTDQNNVRDLFNSQHFGVMLLIFTGLGFLLAFTPCVLPMIPILTSIIVGHQHPVTSRKAFLLALTYVLSASVTYAAAGVAAASMGSSLQTWLQKPWIIAITSVFFVILSLSLFGLYELQLPRNWQNRITSISRKQKGGTYIGVFIMGVISTLIVSPCVTAPLVGVLMYIAQSGDKILGAGALFAIGIGMGIPLIVIGVSAGKWMPRRGPWMGVVQKIVGVAMLGTAVWLLSRVASFTSIIIFFIVLLFSTTLFFGIYRPFLRGQRFNRWIGLIVGGLAVLFILVINTPLLTRTFYNENHISNSHPFTIVHNIKELTQKLAEAQTSHQPVFLDFYADWCESCVSMDKKIFSHPDVMHILNRFMLLRVDLSANNIDDEALLKKYDVIAPPTVLFFNNQGQEVNSQRIVGELTVQEFMIRINTFITASCDKNLTC